MEKKKKRKEERLVVAWRVKEKRLLTEDGIHHQVVAFEDSSVHYLEKRNIEIGSLLGQILKKRRKTPLKKWQNFENEDAGEEKRRTLRGS